MAHVKLSNSMDMDRQSDTREGSPQDQINIGTQMEGYRPPDPVRGAGPYPDGTLPPKSVAVAGKMKGNLSSP